MTKQEAFRVVTRAAHRVLCIPDGADNCPRNYRKVAGKDNTYKVYFRSGIRQGENEYLRSVWENYCRTPKTEKVDHSQTLFMKTILKVKGVVSAKIQGGCCDMTISLILTIKEA